MSGQTWKVLVQTKEIMKVDVIISVTAERARPPPRNAAAQLPESPKKNFQGALLPHAPSLLASHKAENERHMFIWCMR